MASSLGGDYFNLLNRIDEEDTRHRLEIECFDTFIKPLLKGIAKELMNERKLNFLKQMNNTAFKNLSE